MTAQYKIVSGADLGALQLAVQEAIDEGWTPHGSVFYSDNAYRKELVRADVPATEGAAAAEAA